MKYELTPREELYSRITKFQKQLQKNEVSGALLSENSELFYFSGTIQRSFLFIPAQGEPVLAVNGNMHRALDESKLKYVVPLQSLHHMDAVLTDYDYSITGRIGMDLEMLPASYYLSMQRDFKNAEFVDVAEIIKRLRMIKSNYEIEKIRRACRMQDEVMQETLHSVHVGMTELDVDALLTAFIRRQGHQGQFRSRGYNQQIHYSHVLFGKASALATYVKGPLGGMGTTPCYPIGASFNVITENQPLIIDFGVGVGGYVSDMTRTFVIGRLPKELERAHGLAREIKHFMENCVQPGKSIAELYSDIIEMVNKRGLSNHFMGFGASRMPFIGHGIGLDLDEYPVIAPNFNGIFQEGMVFAFEPKFAFPERGAAGIEDDFVVTSNGVERLTTYDDNILVIKKNNAQR